MVQGFRIHVAADFSGSQQCLDFGGEGETAGTVEVVKGLDSNSVAHEEQRAVALVENGEGEHSSQKLQHPFAVLLIEMDQHLGI